MGTPADAGVQPCSAVRSPCRPTPSSRAPGSSTATASRSPSARLTGRPTGAPRTSCSTAPSASACCRRPTAAPSGSCAPPGGQPCSPTPGSCGCWTPTRPTDVVYVVSEWVSATNLADLLADGPLQPAEARQLAVEVAEALSAAHRAGLAHLCLQPEHVLRTSHGQVKLAGLAVDAAVRGVAAADDTDAAAPRHLGRRRHRLRRAHRPLARGRRHRSPGRAARRLRSVQPAPGPGRRPARSRRSALPGAGHPAQPQPATRCGPRTSCPGARRRAHHQPGPGRAPVRATTSGPTRRTARRSRRTTTRPAGRAAAPRCSPGCRRAGAAGRLRARRWAAADERGWTARVRRATTARVARAARRRRRRPPPGPRSRSGRPELRPPAGRRRRRERRPGGPRLRRQPVHGLEHEDLRRPVRPDRAQGRCRPAARPRLPHQGRLGHGVRSATAPPTSGPRSGPAAGRPSATTTRWPRRSTSTAGPCCAPTSRCRRATCWSG